MEGICPNAWKNGPISPLCARQVSRHLIEDHNYVFNHAPQEILRRIGSREFADVTHVEVLICLDILGPSGFADPNSPHTSPAAPSPTSCPTSRRSRIALSARTEPRRWSGSLSG